MGYHDLSGCTLTADERCAEAQRIVEILSPNFFEMTEKEQDFVQSMDNCTNCSVKQLFWLRDIKDKYI